jgi:hypothetical protein
MKAEKLSQKNLRLVKLSKKHLKKKVVKKPIKSIRLEEVGTFNQLFIFGLQQIGKPSKVADVAQTLIQLDHPLIKEIATDKKIFTQQLYNVASTLGRTGKLKREKIDRGYVYGTKKMFKK